MPEHVDNFVLVGDSEGVGRAKDVSDCHEFAFERWHELLGNGKWSEPSAIGVEPAAAHPVGVGPHVAELFVGRATAHERSWVMDTDGTQTECKVGSDTGRVERDSVIGNVPLTLEFEGFPGSLLETGGVGFPVGDDPVIVADDDDRSVATAAGSEVDGDPFWPTLDVGRAFAGEHPVERYEGCGVRLGELGLDVRFPPEGAFTPLSLHLVEPALTGHTSGGVFDGDVGGVCGGDLDQADLLVGHGHLPHAPLVEDSIWAERVADQEGSVRSE